jgi:hypothetical protein
MTDDRPFTKGDAAELEGHLEKLLHAKLETMNERISGLRNWAMGVIGAAVLLSGSSVATHQAPQQQVKTAIAVARALL